MARIIPIRVDRLLSNRLPNQPSAFEMKTITDDTNNAIYLSCAQHLREKEKGENWSRIGMHVCGEVHVTSKKC
ncbi:hypothetical protein BLOT_011721 [Blomia tropicalis]|nr:hypothetical protein BLOT_011721 [Blomia tropicalis]